jgi:hypothetical protein|tara:strand:- start:198 stop:524 length:327 start_codon:yes stop_codon:yes gene_type:complete
MNLIVVSNLTLEPLSEGLYFRFLTLVAKHDLLYDILIESEPESIDFYWKTLKKRGLFDFVDDFTSPETREEGVRIDTTLSFPRTIRSDGITVSSTPSLLGQLKFMKDL